MKNFAKIFNAYRTRKAGAVLTEVDTSPLCDIDATDSLFETDEVENGAIILD